ncbi:unnamed protein product [Thelazia callipaeda]|uniref:Ig-like domain-containing protein n=1 Tax=Thelazia callipaeda TaxID=103827 RepID=A0A0N5CRT9_THECL|nr:unnamed protein product [Thelazia callipaeda]
MLDLSHNDIETIPGIDLLQIVGLRNLRIGSNRITRLTNFELKHPMLQVLDLSYSSNLRIVEQFAFLHLPNLQTVNLSHSNSLSFISPRAFVNNTMLYSVDISHCGLIVLPDQLLLTISKGFFDHNPLQCGCIMESIKMHTIRSNDFLKTACTFADGYVENLTSYTTWTSEECHIEPILPFGDYLEATIGEQYSIYCVSRQPSDSILWKFPNNTKVLAQDYMSKELVEPDDLHFPFPNSYYRSSHRQLNKADQKIADQPRVWTTKEQIWLDVVLAEDEGEYECTVKRADDLVHRKIQLKVKQPSIMLRALEVGSHYVTLSWNASLYISSKKRINFYVAVRDNYGITIRMVQLSLQNPWNTYNIMRLKAGENYTFCLCYALLEGADEIGSGKLIYETCLQERTASDLSFFGFVNLSIFLLIISIIIFFSLLALFRFFRKRFQIWQQQKHKSRMNQSISGQSFISSTSNEVDSTTITYANQFQLSVCQVSSMNQFPVANTCGNFGNISRTRNAYLSGRLSAKDLAL